MTIAVEPEKAGTIQNTAAVFVQGVSEPLDTDTESTNVKGGGGGDGGGGHGGGPAVTDVPQGDQCSPVVGRTLGSPSG